MLGYVNKVWLLSGFLKQWEKIKYLGALEDNNGVGFLERGWRVLLVKIEEDDSNLGFLRDI